MKLETIKGGGEATDLTTIKTNTRPLIAEIKTTVIDSPETATSASELISIATKQMKLIVEREDRVIAPLKEALEAKKAEWSPMKKVLKAGIEGLRTNLGAYQTAEVARVEAEEAKIATRMAKGTLKTETAVRKMNEVAKPETKIATMEGSVSFRTDTKLNITDEALIPREYLVVDEKKLLDALKAGVEVAGAETKKVQTVVNR